MRSETLANQLVDWYSAAHPRVVGEVFGKHLHRLPYPVLLKLRERNQAEPIFDNNKKFSFRCETSDEGTESSTDERDSWPKKHGPSSSNKIVSVAQGLEQWEIDN